MDLMNMDLLLKLRRNTRKRRVRDHKRVLGTSIDQRPECVNERVEFGHWEVDTVIGSKRKEEPVLLTLVERVTRYTIILKIEGKTEAAVYGAMSQLACLPNASQLFKTMTADNGSEFAGLEACMKGISEVYFAHPPHGSEEPMRSTMAFSDVSFRKDPYFPTLLPTPFAGSTSG